MISAPWPAQVLPDPRARDAFPARLGLPGLDYADRRIEGAEALCADVDADRH